MTTNATVLELIAKQTDGAYFNGKVGDTLWLMFCGFLVFFMQCGFALLEAGTVRAKNTKNILMKNLLDACVGAIIWYSVGYYVAVSTPVHAIPSEPLHSVVLVKRRLSPNPQQDKPFAQEHICLSCASASREADLAAPASPVHTHLPCCGRDCPLLSTSPVRASLEALWREAMPNSSS